ncbi:MAG: 5-formyltetrahydrofolate cyclo-ligase [Thermoprotei archaeon]|nr:MAG: 5-formyltetrahydrofolate cyclo-ligase [Thermoprotei archaeon]
MERLRVALPPYPCRGRIPNFKGADVAAGRLRQVKEYVEAKTVLVNPDSPQLHVRRMALLDGKSVVMPTPRLRQGFLLLTPERVKGRVDEACTIKGAFKYGLRLDELPEVDFIVEGSVAVDLDGNRLGKGGGYGDIEIGMAKSKRPDVAVATTVHSIQVVDRVPAGEQDYRVDYIATERALFKARLGSRVK